MSLSFATSLRTTRITAILNAIDNGIGPGTRKIYTGIRPATGAEITTESLLGTLVFSKPCGVVTAGILTFAAITQDVNADATGSATWYRDADGDGTFVMDGSVTVTGGGGDMTLNNTSIIAGCLIDISGMNTITEGGV